MALLGWWPKVLSHIYIYIYFVYANQLGVGVLYSVLFKINVVGT